MLYNTNNGWSLIQLDVDRNYICSVLNRDFEMLLLFLLKIVLDSHNWRKKDYVYISLYDSNHLDELETKSECREFKRKNGIYLKIAATSGIRWVLCQLKRTPKETEAVLVLFPPNYLLQKLSISDFPFIIWKSGHHQ